MATKYILQSGGMRKFPPKQKAFHDEVFKNQIQPRVLMCIFAQQREYWEEKFALYTESILAELPENVKPIFTLALPNTFEVDCKKSDIIYCAGGDDQLAQLRFGAFDLKTLWAEKVVATNSATSDMLCTAFWPCDWRTTMDGLGLLPIKFIAHYNSDWGIDDPRGPIDWKKALIDLKAYGDTSLPIHALPEGDFIVIEQ